MLKAVLWDLDGTLAETEHDGLARSNIGLDEEEL
jgi:phosphoglycolate phosphatase-like HAD superfamily hydrolase